MGVAGGARLVTDKRGSAGVAGEGADGHGVAGRARLGLGGHGNAGKARPGLAMTGPTRRGLDRQGDAGMDRSERMRRTQNKIAQRVKLIRRMFKNDGWKQTEE